MKVFRKCSVIGETNHKEQLRPVIFNKDDHTVPIVLIKEKEMYCIVPIHDKMPGYD